jgi:hypothetical protein
MISSTAQGALDKVVVRAAARKYEYGDGRSSTCGPTAIFAARDLRYAPIIPLSQLASTVPDYDDVALELIIAAGVDAGYFVYEGEGIIVTFAGHRHARNVEYRAGRHARLFFEELPTGVSLSDAILLYVSDGYPRIYPAWLGEIEITFPNATPVAIEQAIRQLQAQGLLQPEAATKNLRELPFHIDDVALTPLVTTEGNRAAARLRTRPDVQALLHPLSPDLGHSGTPAAIDAARIFIGHGRAHDWRELKDFIQNRLGYEVVDFNSEPTAGIATKDRLEKMLEISSFAFIVATAEDAAMDGTMHARDNVIHEIGLFQGRLGFLHAIVLLGEGCAEFSNIAGLGQMRFAPNRIASLFEDVRHLLETRLPEPSYR